MIKSGTDFQEMSKVTLTFETNMKPKVTIEKIVINRSVPEDVDVKKMVEENIGTLLSYYCQCDL